MPEKRGMSTAAILIIVIAAALVLVAGAGAVYFITQKGNDKDTADVAVSEDNGSDSDKTDTEDSDDDDKDKDADSGDSDKDSDKDAEEETEAVEAEADLGIRGLSVEAGSDIPEGVYVDKVFGGSCADKAGIRKGYVIVQLDGKTIDSTEKLDKVLSSLKPGDEVLVVMTVKPNDSDKYSSNFRTYVTLDSK